MWEIPRWELGENPVVGSRRMDEDAVVGPRVWERNDWSVA